MPMPERARRAHPQACARACRLVATLGALAFAASATATVLRFDQALNGGVIVPTGSLGGSPPPGYGDHVDRATVAVAGATLTYDQAGEGFTPEVQVDFFATGATASDPQVRLWHEGYGSLINVLFTEGPGTAGAPELFVRLTANPGFVVDLYGFDLAAFAQRDLTIAGIEVFAGTTLLHTQGNTLVEGDASGLGYTPIVFSSPLSAPELLLRVNLSNLAPAIQDNIGLDNLRFGQTPPPAVQQVPEPSVAGLLAAAMVAAVTVRRRRRR